MCSKQNSNTNVQANHDYIRIISMWINGSWKPTIKGDTIRLLGWGAGVFFICFTSCLQYFIYFTLHLKPNISLTCLEFFFLFTKLDPKPGLYSINVGVKETSEVRLSKMTWCRAKRVKHFSDCHQIFIYNMSLIEPILYFMKIRSQNIYFKHTSPPSRLEIEWWSPNWKRGLRSITTSI